MKPTVTLMHEHEMILMVLAAAEREVKSAKERGALLAEKVQKMLDFFGEFVDRCHHTKEEKYLFIRMQERGMSSEDWSIVVMLHEHEMGRQLVKNMAEMLPLTEGGSSGAKSDNMSNDSDLCCGVTNKGATAEVVDNLTAYVQQLRDLISKEDNVLYVMADKIFTPEDQQELERAFKKFEEEEIGIGVYEKYRQLAHEIAES